jgi:flagellar basal-body rod modification protein FlgD
MSSSVPSVGQQGQQSTNTDAFQNLNMKDFVNLLVTELQQQDPMNPMDNSQILQQVSQIQQIQSTQSLTSTLTSVMLGQNVATGANLLNRNVTALDDQQQTVTGVVNSISVADGKVQLHIGDHTVDLANVSQILGDGVQPTPST